MNKISNLIIKGRLIIIIAVLAISAVCIFFVGKVSINYSLSDYLAKDTETSIALKIMEKEFSLTGNIQLTVKNVDAQTANSIKSELSKIDKVLNVTFDAESQDYFKSGAALFEILIDGDDFSGAAVQVSDDISELMREKYPDLTDTYGGSSINKQLLQDSITSQIPLILLISICIVAVILLLSSSSWLEPLIFLAVAGVSILINMGTNVMFGSISYVTNSVAAILQLALSMDYGIVLLHAYHKNQENCEDDKESMRRAIAACANPISCSALTTIAGLLALLFMSFTIGFDIGMVLMKGIVISAILVFILLPAITLTLSKAINKTKKQTLVFSAKPFTAIAVKGNKIIAIAAAALIIVGFFLQSTNTYIYTDDKTTNQIFDSSSTLAVVVDKGTPYDKQKQFIEELSKYKTADGKAAVKNHTAYFSTVLEEFTPEMVANKFALSQADTTQLFTMQHLYEQPDDHKMSMSEFLQFANHIIENDSSAGAFIDEQTALDVKRLSIITGALSSNNTAEQLYTLLSSGAMENYLNISKDKIDLLYTLYYMGNAGSANQPVKGADLLTYAAYKYDTDAAVRQSMGVITYLKLKAMLAVHATFIAPEKLDYITVTAKLSTLQSSIGGSEAKLGQDKISGVFIMSMIAGGNAYSEPIAANVLLGFINENMETNALLSAKLSSDMKAAISDANIQMGRAENLFNGTNYSRIIVTVNLSPSSEYASDFAKHISDLSKQMLGDNTYVAGELMSINDIKSSFSSDLLIISIVTFISILLIVMLTFRSLSIPVILTMCIEGAIWISMSISALINFDIFFMSYIVVSCILMGATIDYGILISSSYIENRKAHGKRDALLNALNSSIPSIFTSGLILITAGFVIFFISTEIAISTVGLLLGQGTIISILMILFVLPSILYLADKLILKTTMKSKKNKEIE